MNNYEMCILKKSLQIGRPFLPPPGAITPAPPPDLGDNNFPFGGFSSSSISPSSPSTTNVPNTSFTTNEEGDSTFTNTYPPLQPQDNNNIPPSFQPHVPSTSKKNESVDIVTGNNRHHRPSSPVYNATDPVDARDRDQNDYPEIPDNEIGVGGRNSSLSSEDNVGVGIPQQERDRKKIQNRESSSGDGHMLVTTIPIVAILAIILITAATLYLVNKKKKMRKRPVKEIVSMDDYDNKIIVLDSLLSIDSLCSIMCFRTEKGVRCYY